MVTGSPDNRGCGVGKFFGSGVLAFGGTGSGGLAVGSDVFVAVGIISNVFVGATPVPVSDSSSIVDVTPSISLVGTTSGILQPTRRNNPK
jgi:hypothetical protein